MKQKSSITDTLLLENSKLIRSAGFIHFKPQSFCKVVNGQFLALPYSLLESAQEIVFK